MRVDVAALLKKYKVKTFGNKRHLLQAENAIQAGESLYYIAPTNIKLAEINGAAINMLPGIVFISDRRVFFQQAFSYENVIEFKLHQIHSVGSKNNGITGGHISFCTSKVRVDFLVDYRKTLVEEIRRILIQAIANADDTPEGRNKAERNNLCDSQTAPQNKVVECPGCGATNIVSIGCVGQCEYCQRYIE